MKKKGLLHLSLTFLVFYVLASAAVLAFQMPLKMLLANSQEIVGIPIFPPLQILGIGITAVVGVVFYLLLLKGSDRPDLSVELAAVIVLSVILLVSPYVLLTGSMIENSMFAQYGVNMVANYSVLTSLLSFVRPISYAPYLLMIVYSAVLIGQKKRN